ncbi:hypothetical protein BESB_068610 [Besnoitia besnoiti]|uniref:HAT C-terminal dimerisation domain-containing protein n=1 Tax=Besnoitia besnoiti TaxID=94643 RepID=A0A2A9M8M3_BESBE|nr:hypothetical protein BESB_068610 [Besnoitia besnoiti]PFH34828.1 hypothetical protein BESB_068610 [Besnoitia besnoiti]
MQGHALSHALRDSGSEDLLTEEEQQLLAELVVFLRTFKDAADVLSDSDQSTISLVFPTLRALKRLCVRPSLTAPMHALRSKLLGALERRFAESEHEIFLTATLLDLRFKHMVDRDREWKVAFLRQALRNTRERPPVPPAPPVGGAVGAQERARPPCSQAPFAAAGAEAPATLNGALSGESPDAGGRPKSAALAAAAGGHSGVFAVSPGAWLGATNGSPVSNAPQPGDPSSSPAFPALAGAAAGAVASANGAASAGLVPAAAAGATSGTASSPPVAGHGVGSLELPRQRTPAAGSGGNGGGGGATTPGGGRGQKGQRHLAGGGGNEAAGAGSMQLAVALAAQQAKKRRLLDFYAILYEGEEEVRFQPAAAGVDGGPGGQGGAEHTEEEEGEAADEEIGRYLDASCVRSRHMEGLSILQWWKINGVQFPRLARLALTLLVVPAGSLAAGDLEEKRARLSGPLVDQLLFLNRNRRAC